MDWAPREPGKSFLALLLSSAILAYWLSAPQPPLAHSTFSPARLTVTLQASPRVSTAIALPAKKEAKQMKPALQRAGTSAAKSPASDTPLPALGALAPLRSALERAPFPTPAPAPAASALTLGPAVPMPPAPLPAASRTALALATSALPDAVPLAKVLGGDKPGMLINLQVNAAGHVINVVIARSGGNPAVDRLIAGQMRQRIFSLNPPLTAGQTAWIQLLYNYGSQDTAAPSNTTSTDSSAALIP